MINHKFVEKTYDFLKSLFPNRKESINQIILKVFYLIMILAVLISGIYIGNHFISLKNEEKVIEEYRSIWKNENLQYKFRKASAKNNDFKGWIKFENSSINYPIFQTDDNSFYLNHSADKKKSENGSLLFDYRCKITPDSTDKNLIIYGKNNNNLTAFGELKKLRNIAYFREHSSFEFSVNEKTDTYLIYSVFVLNAKKEDDGGYIYNIYRNKFLNDTDFANWISEAKERSLINTSTEVTQEDNILTLVTDCDDFENARLVVMAKKAKQGSVYNPNEKTTASANHQPLYPKKWYSERGINKE